MKKLTHSIENYDLYPCACLWIAYDNYTSVCSDT